MILFILTYCAQTKEEGITLKDILFVGNVSLITDAMLEPVIDLGRPVICGITDKKYSNKKVVTYPYREDNFEFQGIFRSYEIDSIVYLSKSADGQKRLHDEMDLLENTLYFSNISGVKNFIYISTNDYLAHPTKTRSRMLANCEEMCEQVGKDTGMNVTVLRVPYVFSTENQNTYLYRTIQNAIKNNIIELVGKEDKETSFICDVDLGEVISRNLDDPLSGFTVSNIAGGENITFGELAKAINEFCPNAKTEYKGYTEAVPTSINDRLMNERYGWFAKQKVSECIEEIADYAGGKKNKKNWLDVFGKLTKRSGRLVLIAVEIVAFFLLSEFFSALTNSNSRVDYVDFRLLFVVIIGMFHGAGAGIIAALLACIGYFRNAVLDDGIQLVFFNINNWLPFGVYFLCGTIVGHVCDKYKETIKFTSDQQELLENKYVFLNELYSKTLENKENYSRQIMGYQDSLGKIYNVVKNLNTASNDEVMFRSVNAIEEIMENESAAVYYVGEGNAYARLAICSRAIKSDLVKSLRVDNLPNVNRCIARQQSWYNTSASLGEPAYVAPITRDGKTVAIIVLWKATANQMKLDYFNRFNIMCGLIQQAVIRAMDYAEYEEADQMYPGTRFFKKEYFEEKLSIQKMIDSDGMSDYLLMKIIAPGKTLKETSEYISNELRVTDIVGIYENNEPYALLSQTTMSGIISINERLQKVNISLVEA